MKNKVSFIVTLCLLVVSSLSAQKPASCSQTCSWQGWRIDSIAPGYVWYNYTGYYPPLQVSQTVNVLVIDQKNYPYYLEIVHSEEPDSLSAFAEREQAIAGINGSYFEPEVSYVRVKNKTYREVTLDPSHVRYWKHEGAFFYDSKTKKAAIAYGNNESYRKSPFETVLSGAPVLIDNYEPVGETFAAMPDSVPLKSLDYEDYRRHQGARHPRVAIGITTDEKILLVAVDGRWQSSVGMSAKELTQFISRFFNPQYLLNLDGGGSTTVWIKDRGVCGTNVVNYPTDNKQYNHFGQRMVNNVILLRKNKP